jgi:Tfp pilus assembly protein FimV
MSVAVEYVPVVAIPERARRPRVEEPIRLASVAQLHAPSDPVPLRLTRRGVAVVAALVAALALGIVVLAARSAPPATASSAHPATVTVRAGDSLWSIATRVAPDRDPRAEIEALQRANHLAGVTLVPGQVLRVP